MLSVTSEFKCNVISEKSQTGINGYYGTSMNGVYVSDSQSLLALESLRRLYFKDYRKSKG